MSFITGPAPSKPWLMSNKASVAQDERERENIIGPMLRKYPFPGTKANHTKKIEWMKNIGAMVDEIMEESFYMSPCPEGVEIINDIFMKFAPETLNVQIMVQKSDLKLVTDASRDAKDDNIFEETFKDDSSGTKSKLCAKYELPQSGANWKDYAAWLKNQDEHPTKSTIELGTIECSKDETLNDKVSSFLRELGIRQYLGRIELAHRKLLTASSDTIQFSHVEQKVGENRYFPCPDDADTGLCISIRIHLEKPSEVKLKNAAFTAPLNKMMAESKELKRDTCVYYKFLVKDNGNNDDDDSDEYDSDEEYEERPPLIYSNETVHVLWLPLEYPDEHNRCFGHFLQGEGENHIIQRRLQKGNTDTGNTTIFLFQCELDYMKRRGRTVREKFATALSLTEAATYGDMMYGHDNESPEVVVDCVKILATFWRVTLLTKSDEELGIGDGKEVPAGELSPSRDALYTILGNSAKRFEEIPDYGGAVKFNWKPGKSRKRKS